MISDWQSWWWRWFQPISIARRELTVLAAIGWHNRPRMTNLQYCPEPTLFCFLPGVSWRANHQSYHWCRKRHIVSRIAILLHCRIGDLLSPLSSARLWCLVSVSRWLVLIYMCKYMGLHLGLQYFERRIPIRDAEILSVGKIAEFAKFAGEKDESLQTSWAISKQPSGLLRRAARGSGINRAKRVMDGRGLTGCRSAADAGWQSSDTALPIGQVFWRLAVLIFSLVRWV